MRALAIVAFAVWSVTANAAELIVDHRPFYARGLAGVVTDRVGYALPGATVQVVSCDGAPGNAGVVKETVSDAQGKFLLGRFTSGKACLRFSKDGFSSVQITVYPRQDAPELAQKLIPAM